MVSLAAQTFGPASAGLGLGGLGFSLVIGGLGYAPALVVTAFARSYSSCR